MKASQRSGILKGITLFVSSQVIVHQGSMLRLTFHRGAKVEALKTMGRNKVEVTVSRSDENLNVLVFDGKNKRQKKSLEKQRSFTVVIPCGHLEYENCWMRENSPPHRPQKEKVRRVHPFQRCPCPAMM